MRDLSGQLGPKWLEGQNIPDLIGRYVCVCVCVCDFSWQRRLVNWRHVPKGKCDLAFQRTTPECSGIAKEREYVCVCACIYMCLHLCIFMCLCIYVCVFACFLFLCICFCVCLHMHVYVQVCVYVCECASAHVYGTGARAEVGIRHQEAGCGGNCLERGCLWLMGNAVVWV